MILIKFFFFDIFIFLFFEKFIFGRNLLLLVYYKFNFLMVIIKRFRNILIKVKCNLLVCIVIYVI